MPHANRQNAAKQGGIKTITYTNLLSSVHLFDDKDFFNLVRDPEMLAVFKLTEGQGQVIHMHVVKGYTFEFIGSVFRISKQAVHKTYERAVKKMRKTIVEMLRKAARQP